jgi:LysM repeat protein
MRQLSIVLALVLWLSACVSPTGTPPTTVTLLPLPSGTPSPIGTPVPRVTPVIIASPTPSATPVTHVVREGETLISIAYNYGIALDALQQANPTVSPRFLSVGTALIIPLSPDAPPVAVGAPTPMPVTFGPPACHALSTGAMYCFVEARNPGGGAVEGVTARITLAGADGLPLTDGIAYPALDAVPPGGVVTLAAFFTSAPANIAAIGVTPVTAYPLGDVVAHYVPLEVVALGDELIGGEWQTTVELRNTSAVTAATAKAVLTLFDEAGAILGYREVPVVGGLAAGSAQTVTITATPLSGTVARYTVQAQGRP